MNRFEKDVVIITGASQGMGASHARAFAAEGAKVIITDILEEKGQALAKEIGDNAIFVKQDVTSEKEWNELIQLAEDKFGPVTVLVNNAGVPSTQGILDLSLDDYMRVININ